MRKISGNINYKNKYFATRIDNHTYFFGWDKKNTSLARL